MLFFDFDCISFEFLKYFFFSRSVHAGVYWPATDLILT